VPAAVTEDDFRAEARAFLEATVPRKGMPAPRTDGDGIRRAKRYQHALAEAGFAGITWPAEYGGRGLSGRYQRWFDREANAFVLPPKALEIGLGMCGPTILTYATDAQKRALIPPLLRGDHVWCELFSEPGAGSDLASVQTRARADGDTWVLDGQKVWTSDAHHSDYAACLARTDVDRTKREGITMFLVDMHAPGVTVRPLRQMTGETHFSEVFLDAVPVPAANVLGGVNDGWRVGRTMLAFERKALGGMGSSGGGRGGIAALVDAARARDLTGDPEVRQRLAGLRIQQMVLRHLAGYLEASGRAGRSTGGEASVLKLAMAHLVQDSAAVAVDIVGPDAVAWGDDAARGGQWSWQLCNARSASIGGGTNEVIRNVIAERVLGLPRDVEVDDVPFRELKVGTQRES
jgi:alkylation response protein AidB-like acyl-CoA dehydrogenase